MAAVYFDVDGNQREGYLALPEGGKGKGLLVLHAWWGLNDFFKQTCDRLAEQGFVAFAPDVHHGRIATTPDEAMQILETRDFPAAQATAEAGLKLLQTHPSVQGRQVGVLGFSMGAAFALLLDEIYPDAFDKAVLVYGPSEADFSKRKARFQCHFAENDEWEPIENVKQIKADNAEVYVYPQVEHWFFEADRDGYYNPEAAALAWERMVEFLK